uniref:Uncharacterized protein n=1 Tax=Chromera velia CCMP2878 TaxID=1169474 RepID=A0A0G4IAY6_9ALVE|eukprot:Cvel_12715.t1-p1 / transcript=Cvel_12715.t1 / gene=Cvel_12715 / organism=Chromera_velia_CCMP2878 / gene_product=hypothetical protein / transcript_product=hypothetical protein / location=Cvel_scaffold843:43281-44435(-) / protein_length=385 / sequence_SO=supercontig / SO=protein_coding / is_pseudo=false
MTNTVSLASEPDSKGHLDSQHEHGIVERRRRECGGGPECSTEGGGRSETSRIHTSTAGKCQSGLLNSPTVAACCLPVWLRWLTFVSPAVLAAVLAALAARAWSDRPSPYSHGRYGTAQCVEGSSGSLWQADVLILRPGADEGAFSGSVLHEALTQANLSFGFVGPKPGGRLTRVDADAAATALEALLFIASDPEGPLPERNGNGGKVENWGPGPQTKRKRVVVACSRGASVIGQLVTKARMQTETPQADFQAEWGSSVEPRQPSEPLWPSEAALLLLSPILACPDCAVAEDDLDALVEALRGQRVRFAVAHGSSVDERLLIGAALEGDGVQRVELEGGHSLWWEKDQPVEESVQGQGGSSSGNYRGVKDSRARKVAVLLQMLFNS